MSSDESQLKPSHVKPESDKQVPPPLSPQDLHEDIPSKPLPFDDTGGSEPTAQVPDKPNTFA